MIRSLNLSASVYARGLFMVGAGQKVTMKEQIVFLSKFRLLSIFKLLNSSIGMTKGAVASDILKNRHIFMTVIGCCFTCANAAILIFFSKIAEYNFHIGRNRPSIFPPSKNPQMAEALPLPNFPNCSSVWGFGRIGMTTDVIINFEEERLKKWQLERDDSKK